jgi:hypothetical protein
MRIVSVGGAREAPRIADHESRQKMGWSPGTLIAAMLSPARIANGYSNRGLE